jgi:hypothetical protein
MTGTAAVLDLYTRYDGIGVNLYPENLPGVLATTSGRTSPSSRKRRGGQSW